MMTAMLLDSGDGVTHCIPVYDGNVISSIFERMEIAGRHVTNYLLKLLHRRGYAFNSTSDFEIIREIKEKFCFVSGDIEVDNKLALETCIHEKFFSINKENSLYLMEKLSRLDLKDLWQQKF